MVRKALFVTVLTAVLALGLSPLFAIHCPKDLNGDNQVNGKDLDILLACWGPGPLGGVCPAADFDHDGDVDAADLATLLACWGPCLSE